MGVESASTDPDPAPDPAIDAEVARMRPALAGKDARLRAGVLVGIVLSVACLTGVLTGVAMIFPVAATTILLGLALADLSSRTRFGNLPHGTWFLLYGSLTLWTAIGWSMRLDDPMVVTNFRCGTGQAMAMVVLPPFAAMLAGGIAVVVLLGARYLPELPRHLARLVVITCGIMAMVLAPLAIARTLTHPEPDAYVASLPVVATFQRADEGDLECHLVEKKDVGAPAVAPQEPRPSPATERVCSGESLLGPDGHTLRRSCTETHCALSLVTSRGEDVLPYPGARGMVDFKRDQPLEVRYDAAHQLYVFSDKGDKWHEVALSAKNGEPLDISPRDVASSIAPPPSVGLAALVALAFVLFGVTTIALRRQRARRHLAATEGTVDADGWLVLDGAEETRPVRVEHVRPGRVLVLGVRQGEAYRGSGAADVVATSHEEVRAALRRHERDVMSMLAIALPAAIAPVVIATLVGLVL